MPLFRKKGISAVNTIDNAVDIRVRVWVQSPDYWPVFFSMNEKVYKTLPQEGLHFPFPQLDVHLDQ